MTKPKVALITGVNGAVGAALRDELLRAGAVVIGVDITADASGAGPAGARFEFIHADLSKRAELDRIVAAIETRGITLDLFVNCAAVYARRDLHALAFDDIADCLLVNVVPYIYLAGRLAVKSFAKPGYIIGLSSDAAYVGPKKGAHYAASKGAVVSATYSLARSLAPQSILVNCLVPGVVDSEQAQLTDQRRAKFEAEIPLGRVATVEDVVKAIMGLSSGAFDYCTGQKIVINGGRSLL